MNRRETICRCFDSGSMLYSGHARREMRGREFAPITDREVYEATCNGEIIEMYADGAPYPCVLIAGTTNGNRLLHAVCAYVENDDRALIVTVYQPVLIDGRTSQREKDEMRCIVCHSDDIRATEVREKLRVGNDIVYVAVEASVCCACGEKYYDRRTIQFLEQVEQKLIEGKACLHEVGRVLEYN